MPALLTRMSRRPKRSLAPRPRAARRPRGWRHRPRRRAPRRPALPDPCTARSSRSASRPETTTAAPCSASQRGDRGADPAAAAGDDGHLAVERACALTRPRAQRGERLVEARRDPRSTWPRASSTMRLTQAGQHAARAHLDERGGALGGEPLHAVGPPHRAGHLAQQERRHVGRRPGDAARRRSGRRGSSGSRDRDAAPARRASRSAGRRHERAVEGRAHRQHHALAPAALLGQRHRALHGRAVAGDHDLLRRVHVGDLDHLALRGLRAHRLHAPAARAP